jgi:hypothetical protein
MVPCRELPWRTQSQRENQISPHIPVQALTHLHSDLLNHAIQALKRLEETDEAELSGRSTISVRLAKQFPASPPTLVQPPPSNSNSLSTPALLRSTIEEVGEERTSGMRLGSLPRVKLRIKPSA